MATPPFKYEAPFQLGEDTTEYYLLTVGCSFNKNICVPFQSFSRRYDCKF